MQKQWQGEVHINASVAEVFPYIADFSRHPEWDRFTKNLEQTKPAAADGSGAEWKVYEKLGVFFLGERDESARHTTGLAKRHVREVVQNEKVVWHSHPIPNVGISADFTYTLTSEPEGTRLQQVVVVNVPGVVEAVGRLIVRNLDQRQQGQWTLNLQHLKAVCEGRPQDALAPAEVETLKEAVPA